MDGEQHAVVLTDQESPAGHGGFLPRKRGRRRTCTRRERRVPARRTRRPYNRSPPPESELRPATYLGFGLLVFWSLVPVFDFESGFVRSPWLPVDPVLPETDPVGPLEESEPMVLLLLFLLFLVDITSILSARFDAGSKLARTCVPSWIAAIPAATGWPRRSTWVCESTVSVTPWSRVMLFWSTLETEPVTVRRFPWSEEDPIAAVLPAPAAPAGDELVLPLC